MGRLSKKQPCINPTEPTPNGGRMIDSASDYVMVTEKRLQYVPNSE